MGLAGLLAGLAVTLYVTLSPQQLDARQRWLALRVLDRLHALGAPEWFQYAELEFTANIALFGPLGFCLGLVMLRHRWAGAILLGLLSAAVELAQRFFLPDRVSDVRDVVANTVGSCLGLAVAALIFPRERRHSRRR